MFRRSFAERSIPNSAIFKAIWTGWSIRFFVTSGFGLSRISCDGNDGRSFGSVDRVRFVERWLPAAELLPILCMGYVWTPVWATCWQIINTQGRSDLSLKVELICKIISLAVLVATIPFGLQPICYGLALSCLVDIIVIIPYVKQLVGVGYRGIVKNLRSAAMMASISAGVACLSVQGFSSPCPKVIVGVGAGLVSYVLLGVIFKIEEFRILLRYCRR